MKPRTLAVIIFILLILLPLGLYWYFYKSKVTSLILESNRNVPFTVSLKGSFKYKYFPLLDKPFFYQSTCQKSCIFSPIPPLEYGLTITSTGSESIADTVLLQTGDSHKYPVYLIPSLVLIPIGNFFDLNNDSNTENRIGYSQGWKIVFLKRESVNTTGLYIGDRSRPNFVFSLPVLSAKLDASRSFLIIQSEKSQQYILSLDGQHKTIFPYQESIDIVSFSDSWKVRTQNSIYEWQEDTWKKNLRFTDYIDISPRYRIGYIDQSDKEKLSLANLSSENSLFILLDRTNAETRIIKKWKTIRGFFQYEWLPAILDSEGVISKIEITPD